MESESKFSVTVVVALMEHATGKHYEDSVSIGLNDCHCLGTLLHGAVDIAMTGCRSARTRNHGSKDDVLSEALPTTTA